MPIPLPNLDDRTYDDLVEEARALIPSLYPTWTDHNPTDPGIILIELFAWLTEMEIYHLNRVPEANYITFLRLLNGPESDQERTGDLDADIRRTVLKLRERTRSATCDDFEYLAMISWPQTTAAQELQAAGHGTVQRVRCIPRRNLASRAPNAHAEDAPEHVSLIVVTDKPVERPGLLEPIQTALWDYVDERRLLTTRHHVVGPNYVTVTIAATLFLKEDALETDVKNAAVADVQAFFRPLANTIGEQVWPFGRDVYVSEIYELLDQVTGVDYVEDVTLITPDGAIREQRDEKTDTLIGITIHAHELVAVDVDGDDFQIG